jgi:P4 family phage/plasmid primase-like protien
MSTISCKINYPIDIDSNPYELDIQEYLDKIFPDSDIQDFVLNRLAEKLSGHNRREQFIIYTGSGANGKSQFFKLVQNTFGEYYNTFDNSLLNTPKRDANSASPAVASLKGVRLAMTTEPKNGSPFETDKLKELIGGDELVGRQLRKDLIRFIPQYLMGIMCNDIPEMPSTDDGVWRKVYVVPFESKFVTKDEDLHKIGNPDFPNYFKAENLEKQYPEWAPYFLKMLFEKYKYLSSIKFTYKVPERVLEATRNYQMESNVYSQFFNDRIEIKIGSKISKNDIFTAFRDFCSSGNYGQKINKKTFETQMGRFFGKTGNTAFYNGYAFKKIEVNPMTNSTEAKIAHSSYVNSGDENSEFDENV